MKVNAYKQPYKNKWLFTSMGESFHDYSSIQDFEADFLESQPQNAELDRLYHNSFSD